MTFTDPGRPGIDAARPLPSPSRESPNFEPGPRADDRSADRPRSSGLMWFGAIVAAIIVVGGIYAYFGNVENSGIATNTAAPATIQPLPAPATPAPMAASPTTTGQAPAPSTTGQAPAQ